MKCYSYTYKNHTTTYTYNWLSNRFEGWVQVYDKHFAVNGISQDLIKFKARDVIEQYIFDHEFQLALMEDQELRNEYEKIMEKLGCEL